MTRWSTEENTRQGWTEANLKRSICRCLLQTLKDKCFVVKNDSNTARQIHSKCNYPGIIWHNTHRIIPGLFVASENGVIGLGVLSLSIIWFPNLFEYCSSAKRYITAWTSIGVSVLVLDRQYLDLTVLNAHYWPWFISSQCRVRFSWHRLMYIWHYRIKIGRTTPLKVDSKFGKDT